MTPEPLLGQQLAVGLLVVGGGERTDGSRASAERGSAGGLLVAAFPGPIAMMNEVTDAVGQAHDPVEPTRWRLALTRAVGVGVALAGGWYLLDGYGLVGGPVG